MSSRPLLEDEVAFDGAAPEARVLVLACGAIAREVLAVIGLNGWGHVDVRCLPAKLHSDFDRIPGAVDAKLASSRPATSASSSRTRTAAPAARSIPSSSGTASSGCPARTATASSRATTCGTRSRKSGPGDFLPHRLPRPPFDALVVRAPGSTRTPELLPLVFGNYRRLVYLAQTDDPDLDRRAEAAAAFLGLGYERRRTGTASSSRRSRASLECPPVAELTVIWWRDIPAQVTAKEGRTRTARELPPRFQEAIDPAAMRAG